METPLALFEPDTVLIPADRPAAPEPGVYRNVPFATYAAWPCANKSSLDVMHEFSPKHYRYRQRVPRKETAALMLGRAVHLLCESVELYEAEFVVGGPINPKTQNCYGHDTKQFAKWLEQYPGRMALTDDEDAQVRRMNAALLDNTACRAFLQDDGDAELSIVWIDPATKVRCKGRMDMTRPGWGAIGDLKTTECASKEAFARSVSEYGYHRQAAWYLDGAEETYRLTGDPALRDLVHFAFICVEKSQPHGVASYAMHKINGGGVEDISISIGREQNQRLLRIYKNCRETGYWPDYSSEFGDIALPEWQIRQLLRQGI